MNYEPFFQSLSTAPDIRIEALMQEIESSRVGATGYAISRSDHPVLYDALERIVGVPSGQLSQDQEEQYLHDWSGAYDRLNVDVHVEAGKRWMRDRARMVEAFKHELETGGNG